MGWAKDNKNVYVFLELCGQTLEDYIKENGGTLDETELKDIGLKIVKGLHEIHSAGLMHGNLTTQEVVQKRKEWKLSDVGLEIDRKFFDSSFYQIETKAPEHFIEMNSTGAVDVF